MMTVHRLGWDWMGKVCRTVRKREWSFWTRTKNGLFAFSPLPSAPDRSADTDLTKTVKLRVRARVIEFSSW
jgi:hypothetical protein